MTRRPIQLLIKEYLEPMDGSGHYLPLLQIAMMPIGLSIN